jgi:hypothetical protein
MLSTVHEDVKVLTSGQRSLDCSMYLPSEQNVLT